MVQWFNDVMIVFYCIIDTLYNYIIDTLYNYIIDTLYNYIINTLYRCIVYLLLTVLRIAPIIFNISSRSESNSAANCLSINLLSLSNLIQ